MTPEMQRNIEAFERGCTESFEVIVYSQSCAKVGNASDVPLRANRQARETSRVKVAMGAFKTYRLAMTVVSFKADDDTPDSRKIERWSTC